MNRNNLWKMMLLALCSAAMVTGSALAVDVEQSDENEHVPVGERCLSQVERVAIQEMRALYAQKSENGEEITGDEIDPEELQEEQPVALSHNEGETSQASKGVSKSAVGSTYYTTHEGAFHFPMSVSLLGDAVELEDGSIWSVASDDRYKTLDWMTGDIIIITPNHSWFSIYDYRLINVNTGAKVKVNLSIGPIYNGIMTHWVIAIDYAHRELVLEDGSLWKISSLDSGILKNWLPSDTMIIGINDGWFSGSNPNILLDVNMNNYAIGKCLN